MNNDDFLEMFNQVRTIRSRVEGIEQTQMMLVRAEMEKIVPPLIEKMEKDPVLAKVYLHVDGKTPQKKIAEALGISEATVSRRLDKLFKDDHVVVLVDQNASGRIYNKAPVEEVLGLGRIIRKRLSL